MKKVFNALLLFGLYIGSYSSIAQNIAVTPSDKNTSIPLPVFGLNFGLTHLMGDVGLKNGPSPFTQFGYQLTITQQATKFMNVSFDLFTATVYGEEQRDLTNLNFKTTLFSQRLNIEYNFYPLLKPNAKGIKVFQPYIGFGVGALFFRTKGDLKDGTGNTYHFWNDGTIRELQEELADPNETPTLKRDYVYESDLRDANLDGLNKYSQTALTVPINAGIRFQITKNIGLNAGVSYGFNFTDLIDNVNSSSVGARKGKVGNDHTIYGSIGLNVFLGSTKQSAQTNRFKDLDKVETVKTPSVPTELVEVEEVVKSDKRLEPAKEIKEYKSPPAFPPSSSDPEPKPVEKTNSSSKAQPSKEAIKNTPPKKAGAYHWADLNKNEMISPDEVLYFIDLLFEGEAERSIEDIQNLIEYYFDQE
ncbi:hypothetical protein ACFLR1_04955 [Bacteroidota bacterium]